MESRKIMGWSFVTLVIIVAASLVAVMLVLVAVVLIIFITIIDTVVVAATTMTTVVVQLLVVVVVIVAPVIVMAVDDDVAAWLSLSPWRWCRSVAWGQGGTPAASHHDCSLHAACISDGRIVVGCQDFEVTER